MSETTFAQQLMMSNWEMNSQIMQGTFSTLSNINNLQNKNNTNSISSFSVKNNLGRLAYAVEGDSKYKEEIDSNEDGIITYNEYVNYIADRTASKYNIPKNETTFSYQEDPKTGFLKFSVTNMGKVLSAYLNNSVQLPIGFIEKEA